MPPELRGDHNGSAQIASSSPPSSSIAESDMQRLGLGVRSSSPAKRSASERDGDDGIEIDRSMDLDSVGSPRSPKKSYHEHISPMTNRFKPLNGDRTSLRGGSGDSADRERNLDVRRSPSGLSTESSRESPRDTDMSNNSMASSPPTSEEPNIGGADIPSTVPSIPTVDEQVKMIKDILGTYSFQDGAKGFGVSHKWLNRVQSRTSHGLHESFEKSTREGEIGPVDNSDIVVNDHFYGDLKDGAGEPFVPLRPGLGLGTDFELIPPEAWNLMVQWYGVAESSHVIIRYVRNTSPEDASSENLQYELFPPIFTIQKLRNEVDGMTMASMKEKELPAVHLVASRSDVFQTFLRRVKTVANIQITTKVKVWKLVENIDGQPERSGIPTPMSSRANSPAPQSRLPSMTPKLVVDLNAFTSMLEAQREIVDIRDETANEKYNGHLQLGSVGFPEAQTLILEEQIRGSGDEFVSDKARKTAARNGINLSPSQDVISVSKSKANSTQTRRSPTPSGVMTRGRANKKGKTRGCTGLSNLGNTCYMNSALQCIRSVEELSVYFLEQKHKAEINAGNPLGYNGAIAKSYEGFLSAIYDPASSGSFAPRNFKATLGRCQPLFSGYGQQDSQEFLSFLVDGLHEDLNRVVKKPYRENPDSDDRTVHDPEAIKQLGEVYRDNHRARNDSVAMDLFSGFYKNTMVCPMCQKVSVTFDPFSLLTLQLPIESTFQHQILFAPLRNRPIIINIDIDKNSNVRMLKEYVARRYPTARADTLIMAEAYSRRLYKVFEDNEVLSEASIQSNDKLVMFELDAAPSNWPPQQKKKTKAINIRAPTPSEDDSDAESQLSERLAVPIIHRVQDTHRNDFVLWPSIILITRQEAKDYDKIFRKVLQLVSTMTTRDLTPDEKTSERFDSSQQDSNETGLTNDSGTPSEFRKIHARSVEGEDELVDVTMTDARDGPSSETGDSNATTSPVLGSASSKILDPTYFIEPELRNLFSMSYYSSKEEQIPCGWSSVQAGDKFPLIDSRIPSPPSRRQSNSSYTSRSYSGQSPVTSDDELGRDDNTHGILGLSHHSAPSDSEENAPTDLVPRSVAAVKNRIKATTKHFGKKAPPKASIKKNARRNSNSAPQGIQTSEYLIRLGEGIILDWTSEGYSQLFGGVTDDALRGRSTDQNVAILEDAELDAKKTKRAARKKSGVSLEECFEETSKSEILSEENAWYCGRCKELRRATKTLEIWTVPDILVVHLKRFSSSSRLRDKVDVLVDFPTEGLDLNGKVGLPEDKSLTYDLFAVDNHYGGLGGGHYTAYAQNFFDKKWYEYNDSSVHPTSPQNVVTKAAYLLFYRRRSNKPLGPSYLQEIVSNAYAEPDTSQSGEDQRLDGSSSPSGSSGSSLEAPAEANHHEEDRPLLGLDGGDLESQARSALMQINKPTTYNNQNYDEAIGGMDNEHEDPDDPLPGYEDQQQQGFIGPTAQHRFDGPTWNFDNVHSFVKGHMAPPGSDNMDSETLAGSNAPEMGESLQDRMLDFDSDNEVENESFPDGFADSPDMEDASYGDVTHVEHVGLAGQDDDEGEVAEVRVSDEEGA